MRRLLRIGRLGAAVLLAGTLLVALGPPLLSAALPSRGADTSAPGTDPADAAALRGALDRFVAARPLVPGAVLSVTAPGRGLAWRGAAGRAAFLGPPLSPDAPFRTASVTKPFTAAAVLRLVETGRLGLDDAVAPLLPQGVVDAGTTVRQLLQHTSGLGDYGTDPRWLARVALTDRAWTPEQLLAATPGAQGPPGTFRYSDTGYVLLALVLERVTGLPLPAAYRSLLPFDALPATWLEGREPPPPGAGPPAHVYAGPLDLTARDPSYDTAGGGGLVSTSGDLDAFARALFTGRVLRRPGTLDELERTVPDGAGDAYGLGMGQRRIAGQDVWLHTGFLGGFLAWVPALDLSLAGSTNQTVAPPDALIADVIRALR